MLFVSFLSGVVLIMNNVNSVDVFKVMKVSIDLEGNIFGVIFKNIWIDKYIVYWNGILISNSEIFDLFKLIC